MRIIIRYVLPAGTGGKIVLPLKFYNSLKRRFKDRSWCNSTRQQTKTRRKKRILIGTEISVWHPDCDVFQVPIAMSMAEAFFEAEDVLYMEINIPRAKYRLVLLPGQEPKEAPWRLTVHANIFDTY